jgi:hypothetical protein
LQIVVGTPIITIIQTTLVTNYNPFCGKMVLNMAKRSEYPILKSISIIILMSSLISCSGSGSDPNNTNNDSQLNTGSPSDTVTTTSRTINLSWNPPTTYADGETLSTLDGYRIYYGTTNGAFSEVVNIDNPGITSYVIDNLSSNSFYFFVATAIDMDGNESAYSEPASVFIE